MKKKPCPLLSIITVNYNGKAFLKDLLDSVGRLNYPQSRIQMIVVDNHSTDGSVAYIRQHYPWAEVVPLKANLGYAGGNNQGFKQAQGRYIALINNDCVLEPGWAKEMLALFAESQDSKIGAVGSKVVFYYPYMPLKICPQGRDRAEPEAAIGISSVTLAQAGEAAGRSIKYLQGFCPPRQQKGGQQVYWTRGQALLALPIAQHKKDLVWEAAVYWGEGAQGLHVKVGGHLIARIEAAQQPQQVRVRVPKSLFVHKKDLINACGIAVNRSFYARERGFLCFDEGQFEKNTEVFGLSGTSFMIDRRMLEDVGCFDSGFFTYYEDIDLFWRARLRGWKSFVAPKAVARHHHCGTGREWSYAFTYYVLRNRMLMILKCGWPALFFKSWLAFIASAALATAQGARCLLSAKKPQRVDIPIRVKLFFQFFYLFIATLKKRVKIRGNAACPDSQIKAWAKDF